MAPDTRRTLSLALTLAYWTPLPSLALSVQRHTTGQDGLLTPNIAGSRPRPITSASPTAASSPARPLTATETGIWWNTVADTQPATDRFPRFAYLLRHGTHQPESQSEEGYSRRSADPHSDSGRAHASLATNPGARAQCGLGDETALQSCVAASAPGTLGDLPPARRSSPSRNLSSARAAPVPAEPPTSKPVFEDQHRPDLEPRSVAMSSYSPPSTSSSKGGSRTEQLLASTRKGTDRVGNERIMGGETQLSFHSLQSLSQSKHQSQASTDYEDVDEDEQGQDTFSQTEGQTQGEGQPKKKKTRRAGVAITRVRRMQREVRRLAEEEEASTQRQQPTVRVRPRVLFIERWRGTLIRLLALSLLCLLAYSRFSYPSRPIPRPRLARAQRAHLQPQSANSRACRRSRGEPQARLLARSRAPLAPLHAPLTSV